MRTDVTASVIVLRGDQILLLKRDAHWTGLFDYVLEIPGGGVERGESPEDAARRELFEETGITAEELKYLGGAVIEDDRALRFINIFLASTTAEPRPSLDSVHIGAVWMPLEELREASNLSYTAIAGVDLLRRWGFVRFEPPRYFDPRYKIRVATPRGVE